MARLPIPGSDEGSWGDILNDFLNTAHNTDGSLKPSSVASAGSSAFASQSTLNSHVTGTDPHADADYAIMKGGGRKIFVQSTDPALVPANDVQDGDLWIDIS
ncbi:MAG TPA: hypothetical protein VJM32_02125 [Candidatus Saccharimonadales bacterium]|nr:hypothetical protein [Candidatus Saccharimonadales bacterium]